MKKIIHRALERGGGNYGWLSTRYSFSFANWFDPTRMGFGKLRVINDDIIAPLGKFDTHHHDNFEIITIPLEGAVTHEDSLGNKGEVKAGEVQAMSAGTGVDHSEYNASKTETLSLFQIWIEPNLEGAEPRYSQRAFDLEGQKNQWQLLVSVDGRYDSLPIYQDACILRTDLQVRRELVYDIAHRGNGVYVLVIDGDAEVEGELLSKRDALGLSEIERVRVFTTAGTRLLLIEVPV